MTTLETYQLEYKYKSLEKEVTFRLRNAKRSMEKRLANSGNNNARTFANYIKSKTKSRTGVGPLKDTDSSLITGDKEISEKLNQFLASVLQLRTPQTSLYGQQKQLQAWTMSSSQRTR